MARGPLTLLTVAIIGFLLFQQNLRLQSLTLRDSTESSTPTWAVFRPTDGHSDFHDLDARTADANYIGENARNIQIAYAVSLLVCGGGDRYA